MSGRDVEDRSQGLLVNRPFPRGFILSRGPHEIPEGYRKGPVLENFSVDALTEVAVATRDLHFVIILGLAFQETCEDAEAVADLLLTALIKGEDEFYSQLKTVAGRYAIIFGGPGIFRVVADATATRSIFYAENGNCIASHPQLVAGYSETLGLKDPFPFMNGFPGNFTPYKGVKLLTANMVCELWDCRIQRYWPSRRLKQTSADDAAERTLAVVAANLSKAARVAPLKIALTAGFDSRVVLACALEAGVEFETFTYGRPAGGTEIDHKVAKHLAGEFGFAHTSVTSRPVSGPEEANIRATSYTNNHTLAIGGLSRFFGSPSSIGVNGNLFELARDHYPTVKEYEKVLSGARLASMFYYRKLSPNFKKKVAAKIPTQEYIQSLETYFAPWLSEIGGFTGGYYPPVTQFYWEHRMAAWNGPFTIERDFYSSFLVPFNSHELFELFLSVDETERFNRRIPYAILERVSPRLREVPINPAKFPL